MHFHDSLEEKMNLIQKELPEDYKRLNPADKDRYTQDLWKYMQEMSALNKELK